MLPSILGATEASTEPFWYADSSALHHVTTESRNLDACTPYTGNDQLIVGNGKDLSITYIGSLIFASNMNDKR